MINNEILEEPHPLPSFSIINAKHRYKRRYKRREKKKAARRPPT
jgi:hypothetical protein